MVVGHRLGSGRFVHKRVLVGATQATAFRARVLLGLAALVVVVVVGNLQGAAVLGTVGAGGRRGLLHKSSCSSCAVLDCA
eukprot:15473222-Alexandrium_andersonii.AAC.1